MGAWWKRRSRDDWIGKEKAQQRNTCTERGMYVHVQTHDTDQDKDKDCSKHAGGIITSGEEIESGGRSVSRLSGPGQASLSLSSWPGVEETPLGFSCKVLTGTTTLHMRGQY
jgi:hypothetical protein